MTERVGVASLGLKLPSLALKAQELAALRGIDPNKFTLGLGCDAMALCGPGETVVDLAAGAAERALERWGGDRSRIGLLAVGTETAQDMSRPLSAFVADRISLAGPIRSYEVKHACYGGTVALRQALEWRLSGAAQGRAALVVASDVALYAPKDPGEPTQGAGAVAFVVDEPTIATIDLNSYAYAEPAFDFWRPVGESFPQVDGPLSLDCYKKAAEQCFRALIGERSPKEALSEFAALAFHVPFPKMVKKAVVHLGESFGFSESDIAALFERQVSPTMRVNRLVGNAYTASLWISVAEALTNARVGDKIAAFSYGSGFGSEVLSLTAEAGIEGAPWGADLEADLATRRTIGKEEYEQLRAG